jgi:hypothetical protein
MLRVAEACIGGRPDVFWAGGEPPLLLASRELTRRMCATSIDYRQRHGAKPARVGLTAWAVALTSTGTK